MTRRVRTPVPAHVDPSAAALAAVLASEAAWWEAEVAPALERARLEEEALLAPILAEARALDATLEEMNRADAESLARLLGGTP